MSEPAMDISLSLGSNIGDKAGHIREAVALLVSKGIVADLVLSSLYRTAPWGNVAQDWFVNACAAGTTTLAPAAVLARIKAIEVAIGRTTTVRWGPRVIDIDILTFGSVVLDTPALTLPHRDIAARAFVLVPLAEIRPGLVIGGRTVAARAAALADQGVVPLDVEPAP